MSPADKRERMGRFFPAHRQAGLPVTTQRCAVFEAILGRTDRATTFISAVAAPAAAETLGRASANQLPHARPRAPKTL